MLYPLSYEGMYCQATAYRVPRTYLGGRSSSQAKPRGGSVRETR